MAAEAPKKTKKWSVDWPKRPHLDSTKWQKYYKIKNEVMKQDDTVDFATVAGMKGHEVDPDDALSGGKAYAGKDAGLWVWRIGDKDRVYFTKGAVGDTGPTIKVLTYNMHTWHKGLDKKAHMEYYNEESDVPEYNNGYYDALGSAAYDSDYNRLSAQNLYLDAPGGYTRPYSNSMDRIGYNDDMTLLSVIPIVVILVLLFSVCCIVTNMVTAVGCFFVGKKAQETDGFRITRTKSQYQEV